MASPGQNSTYIPKLGYRNQTIFIGQEIEEYVIDFGRIGQ